MLFFFSGLNIRLILGAIMAAASYSFVAETLLPTHSGSWKLRAYRSDVKQLEPIVIYDHYDPEEAPFVRVHDACFTSETLGSLKCDCKAQLDYALKFVEQHGGLVIYLQQEGRGIGLANKLAAYALQEQGLDTVDANRALHLPDDAREYDAVADILNDLGITTIRILSNNPTKISRIEATGVTVAERIPVIIEPSPHNKKYLETKKLRMGHLLAPSASSNETE